MSMNPGVTAQPDASSSRPPSRFGPIALITPSVMATSAARPGAPVPSKTVPPRMTMSAAIAGSGLFDPELGCGVDVVAGEDSVDLGQVLLSDGPADRAGVVLDLRHRPAPDERGRHRGMRDRPAQRELGQALAV